MDSENIIDEAQKVLEQTEEKKEAASFIDFKMVTFTLSDKDYAIDIMHVKEIAKAGRFTYVPNTLPFVLGVYNLRGEIIPILDLRIFFHIEVKQESNGKNLRNLLILSVEDQIFGLVVDKIDKVVGVQKSTIQPPHPLFGDINIKYISGVVENNKRLYVLLDVLRIFTNKDTPQEAQIKPAFPSEALNAPSPMGAPMGGSQPQGFPIRQQKAEAVSEPVAEAPKAAEAQAPQAPKVDAAKAETDLKFIAESLVNYKSFFVSDLNNQWVKRRYNAWVDERGAGNTQLQSTIDADSFLKGFSSVFTGEWWSEEYADTIKNILPDNSAKQIVVWNPGCGKGIEAYSLACILKEKYPDAKIKIFAQDIDLLNVSNASLMSVPQDLAKEWYGSYLIQKANSEYTFNADIKDSIMFEYHDCKNTNVLPMVDIIFARDVLSFCDQASQEVSINDFQEKLKGNGIVIIGDNEILPSKFGFGEKSFGAVTAYTKD